MTVEAQETTTLHGGRLVARRLKAHGVSKLFTLSGGHLFSIYDGCRAEGIDIVDVRHEASATFAAEGWAKVTREPGVAALTAGPGVTNGMSAIASAQQNHSPVLVLGGRAPAMRWGQGSLQEIDHVPFVRPLVKLAATAGATAEIPGLIDDAWSVMRRDHPGPAFIDFPLDVVFMEAEDSPPPEDRPAGRPRADAAAVDRAVALLRDADRPVIMAGTNLYWGHGEDALRALAEAAGVPVFLNGLARGCLPADHPNFFSRARSAALKGADVALVIGVPMDFRLGFGGAFGEETEIVAIDLAEPEREHPREVAAECYGDIAETLGALAGAGGTDTSGWLEHLRGVETEKRDAEREQLDGRPRAAAPDADLRRARPGARPRRDRDRRRRRLRVATPAASWRPTSRAAGSTPARSAASAAAPATRWRPSSPTPSARSCCCSATAPSASPGWSSTRSPATASASSA